MTTYRITLKSGKEFTVGFADPNVSPIKNYVNVMGSRGADLARATMVTDNKEGETFLVINIGEIAAIEKV